MTNTKLIKLLKTLEKEEFLRLGKFLRSPFFNYTQSLVAFYEQLKKAYPVFAEKKLQPEKLWAKVFPDKPFSQGKFLRLCSDLSLQVEKYLVQVELEQPTPAAQHLLIKSLGRRNAFELYEKEVKTRLKELSEARIKDAKWYNEHIDLREEYYFHPMKNKFDKKDESLSQIMDSLDNYFILQKAKIGIGILSIEKVFQRKIPINYLEIIQKTQETDNILLLLYKESFELIQNQKEESFKRLEELFFDNISILSSDDKKLFFYNGLNYSIRKLNRGANDYQFKIFNWYKLGLENSIIQDEDYISEIAFHNIVETGCQVGEFNWVNTFIKQYGDYLNNKIKDNCLLYCNSVLHFHKKEYENVIYILSKNTWLKNYVVGARNLLVRALFENFLLNNSNLYQLQSELQSFELFILRTKEFNKSKLEGHLNLVRILKGLSSKISKRVSYSEIDIWLKKQIESKEKIVTKNWLLKTIKKGVVNT